jgi:hypothetical protein
MHEVVPLPAMSLVVNQLRVPLRSEFRGFTLVKARRLDKDGPQGVRSHSEPRS